MPADGVATGSGPLLRERVDEVPQALPVPREERDGLDEKFQREAMVRDGPRGELLLLDQPLPVCLVLADELGGSVAR